MATMIAGVVVFAAAIVGMAVGVIFSNRCITGSCGGLSSMPDGSDKSLCSACASTKSPAEEQEQSHAHS